MIMKLKMYYHNRIFRACNYKNYITININIFVIVTTALYSYYSSKLYK